MTNDDEKVLYQLGIENDLIKGKSYYKVQNTFEAEKLFFELIYLNNKWYKGFEKLGIFIDKQKGLIY